MLPPPCAFIIYTHRNLPCSAWPCKDCYYIPPSLPNITSVRVCAFPSDFAVLPAATGVMPRQPKSTGERPEKKMQRQHKGTANSIPTALQAQSQIYSTEIEAIGSWGPSDSRRRQATGHWQPAAGHPRTAARRGPPAIPVACPLCALNRADAARCIGPNTGNPAPPYHAQQRSDKIPLSGRLWSPQRPQTRSGGPAKLGFSGPSPAPALRPASPTEKQGRRTARGANPRSCVPSGVAAQHSRRRQKQPHRAAAVAARGPPPAAMDAAAVQQMIQQLLAHSVQEGLLDDQFLQLIQLQASSGSRGGGGGGCCLSAPAPA